MRRPIPTKRLLPILCLISAMDAYSQLHVSEGTRLFVTSADDLHAQGDLSNNGTIDHLTLSGGTAQSITGTGTISNLKVNKSANSAAISSGMQSVTGVLTLTLGTLAADGRLTLKSSSSGTARIDAHGTGTGSITGNVKVERYIDVQGRARHWRTLGFPYSSGVTLSSVSGMAVDFNAGSRSVMYYDESGDNGLYGNANAARNAGFVSLANDAQVIPSGQGVLAWIYGDGSTTGPAQASGNMTGQVVVSSSGTLNESGADVTLPVYFTSTNTNRGWNLVSNPFASSIDWSNGGITKTNVNNAIYRWNPASASWTSWNAGVGTPSNVDAIVESGGAFFVKATGADPVVKIPQSAKVSSATGFVHFGKAPMSLEVPSERISNVGIQRLAGVRLSITGQGNPLPDEAYLDVSKEDATAGFEGRFDAASMGRTSGAGISIRDTEGRGYSIQFDAPIREAGREKRYYPIRVTSPAKGATTIELWTEGAWNPLNSLTLIDMKTGTTLLHKGGRLSHSFTMDELQTNDRFMLAVNHVKVGADGAATDFDVRILGNPVLGTSIDMLVTHPIARAMRWKVIDGAGRVVGKGDFDPERAGIQHRIDVPGLRQTGVYTLFVEMDNGDHRAVGVIRN